MVVTLKAMRVNAGMSQKEAAKSLGITTKTLQNWEQYKTAPDAITYAKMCKLYGCDRDDIFLPDELAKSGF